MPRFDFRCLACSSVFEESIPFGSKAFPKCPSCGKKTEKLLGAPPSIQFKGSGFYKTDSRAAKPAPKQDAKSDATSEAKKDAKASEAKPEAAPAKTDPPAAPKPA
jgi:putative FmdB family regulatory protein